MAYVYQIGSQKGKSIASNMKSGDTYKASDGSTWKKNNDGSVSVTTKSGNTYASTIGATSPTPSAGNKNTGSNSGKGNKGGGTAIPQQPAVDLSSVIAEMQKNSAAWAGADQATRKQLEQSNQKLGASVGAKYDAASGKWTDSTGKDLYQPDQKNSIPQVSVSQGASGTPVKVYLPYENPLTGQGYQTVTGYIGSDNKTYLSDGSRVPAQAIVEAANGKRYIMSGLDSGNPEYVGPDPVAGLPGASDAVNNMMRQIDEALNQLGLLEYPTNEFEAPRIKTMSQTDAVNYATELLKPQYDAAVQRVTKQMAELAAKRGVYDSPVSVGMTGDALAELESSFNTQLAQLTQDLLDKDYNKAKDTLASAMQVWQMNETQRMNAYNAQYQKINTGLSSMSGLLGAMMQNDQNYAQNFGVTPGGQQTLAGQAQQIDIASILAGLTGKVNGLDSYGIKSGTPIYNPSTRGSGGGEPSAAMLKFLAEQEANQSAEQQASDLNAKSLELSNKYSLLPLESQALTLALQDVQGITDNDTKYRYWISQKQELKQLYPSLDLNRIERAFMSEIGYSTNTGSKPNGGANINWLNLNSGNYLDPYRHR